MIAQSPTLRKLHWWDHRRHVLLQLDRALARLLGATAEPLCTIVDFGCGDRPYQELIEQRGCRYIACDVAGEVDVSVIAGQSLALPDESADGVLSSQVLEHVADLDWYLGECRRILKPSGWLLLSTHGTWLYHPHPTDYRRWTRDGLVLELESRGFAVERVEALVGPLAWSTHVRLIGMRHVLLRLPLVGRLLLAPLACLMNLRMAVEDAVTPAEIRETNACVYVTLCRRA